MSTRFGAMTLSPAAAAGTGYASLLPLSARELDVLLLVAEGFRDHEIAERLYVSHHTVGNHMRNILGKLGAPTRAAAVARAVRHGLL